MKKAFALAGSFLLLAMLAWQLPENQDWEEKVDPELLQEAEHGGEVEFLVLLKAQADLSATRNMRTKEEKGRLAFEQLKTTARLSQKPLIRILESEGAPHRSFYIVNALYAKGTLDLIRLLAGHETVANIQPNPQVKLEEPSIDRNPIGWRDQVEWGVQRINAVDVWAMGYTGQGVVVGGQDTGVEWNHPAIRNQYRGWNGADADHNYNWHDAIHEISPLHNDSVPDPSNNPCGLDSMVPCDDHNHGTHITGTMAGDDGQGNQIGVAPGARWIACRNMERGYGSPATYIECFEWFLAPTNLAGQNPDPARAPHVINNSWSCPPIEGCNASNFATMNAVVDNLKAAGIVVVVSAGNSGSNCSTVNAPAAMFENSFTVGATRQNDTIANFSSRGPVLVDGSGRLKPNVAAPGVGVRSATRNGNYASWNGTSMAGPHVAGLVALLISANPGLAGQVETIESIIEQTAMPMMTNQDCNGITGLAIPNAAYGFGRIDALAAVTAALEITSDSTLMEVIVRADPNPAHSYMTIAAANLDSPARLEIFNAAGQLVHQSVWQAGQPEERIHTASWAPGVYFYRLSAGGLNWTGKVSKQ